MKNYSFVKKNEIMLFAGKCIELDINMLGKVSQAQKDKFCLFFSYVEARPIK
jgi:hypothetical protein